MIPAKTPKSMFFLGYNVGNNATRKGKERKGKRKRKRNRKRKGKGKARQLNGKEKS